MFSAFSPSDFLVGWLLRGDLERASLPASPKRARECQSHLFFKADLSVFGCPRDRAVERLGSARLARPDASRQLTRLPLAQELSSSKATPHWSWHAQQLQELAYENTLEVRITVTGFSPSFQVPSESKNSLWSLAKVHLVG